MALRGEAHPKAKLTSEEVKKIRELYSKGFSPRIIARNFNISLWNIKEIIRRKTWKHL
jgi:DNA invertase Pin-like site-specific DNA recombinase